MMIRGWWTTPFEIVNPFREDRYSRLGYLVLELEHIASFFNCINCVQEFKYGIDSSDYYDIEGADCMGREDGCGKSKGGTFRPLVTNSHRIIERFFVREQ